MTTTEEQGKFRVLIGGLLALPPVTLRGVAYTGAELGMLLAVDPGQPDSEASRTPQLISELGRLVAAAFADKEMAEATYRAWRDGMVFKITNDVAYAKTLGFTCNEGVDAKGKEKQPKPPSREAAEGFLRNTPEYLDHYRKQAAAIETWQTLFSAQEAAKARTWAVRGFMRSGGDEPDRSGSHSGNEEGRGSDLPNEPTDVYHGSERTVHMTDADLAELEEQATAGPRSPMPAMPATAPTDPSVTTTTPAGRPPPPPPPPRSNQEPG